MYYFLYRTVNKNCPGADIETTSCKNQDCPCTITRNNVTIIYDPGEKVDYPCKEW